MFSSFSISIFFMVSFYLYSGVSQSYIGNPALFPEWLSLMSTYPFNASSAPQILSAPYHPGNHPTIAIAPHQRLISEASSLASLFLPLSLCSLFWKVRVIVFMLIDHVLPRLKDPQLFFSCSETSSRLRFYQALGPLASCHFSGPSALAHCLLPLHLIFPFCLE